MSSILRKASSLRNSAGVISANPKSPPSPIRISATSEAQSLATSATECGHLADVATTPKRKRRVNGGGGESGDEPAPPSSPMSPPLAVACRSGSKFADSFDFADFESGEGGDDDDGSEMDVDFSDLDLNSTNLIPKGQARIISPKATLAQAMSPRGSSSRRLAQLKREASHERASMSRTPSLLEKTDASEFVGGSIPSPPSSREASKVARKLSLDVSDTSDKTPTAPQTPKAVTFSPVVHVNNGTNPASSPPTPTSASAYPAPSASTPRKGVTQPSSPGVAPTSPVLRASPSWGPHAGASNIPPPYHLQSSSGSYTSGGGTLPGAMPTMADAKQSDEEWSQAVSNARPHRRKPTMSNVRIGQRRQGRRRSSKPLGYGTGFGTVTARDLGRMSVASSLHSHAAFSPAGTSPYAHSRKYSQTSIGSRGSLGRASLGRSVGSGVLSSAGGDSTNAAGTNSSNDPTLLVVGKGRHPLPPVVDLSSLEPDDDCVLKFAIHRRRNSDAMSRKRPCIRATEFPPLLSPLELVSRRNSFQLSPAAADSDGRGKNSLSAGSTYSLPGSPSPGTRSPFSRNSAGRKRRSSTSGDQNSAPPIPSEFVRQPQTLPQPRQTAPRPRNTPNVHPRFVQHSMSMASIDDFDAAAAAAAAANGYDPSLLNTSPPHSGNSKSKKSPRSHHGQSGKSKKKRFLRLGFGGGRKGSSASSTAQQHQQQSHRDRSGSDAFFTGAGSGGHTSPARTPSMSSIATSPSAKYRFERSGGSRLFPVPTSSSSTCSTPSHRSRRSMSQQWDESPVLSEIGKAGSLPTDQSGGGVGVFSANSTMQRRGSRNAPRRSSGLFLRRDDSRLSVLTGAKESSFLEEETDHDSSQGPTPTRGGGGGRHSRQGSKTQYLTFPSAISPSTRRGSNSANGPAASKRESGSPAAAAAGPPVTSATSAQIKRIADSNLRRDDDVATRSTESTLQRSESGDGTAPKSSPATDTPSEASTADTADISDKIPSTSRTPPPHPHGTPTQTKTRAQQANAEAASGSSSRPVPNIEILSRSAIKTDSAGFVASPISADGFTFDVSSPKANPAAVAAASGASGVVTTNPSTMTRIRRVPTIDHGVGGGVGVTPKLMLPRGLSYDLLSQEENYCHAASMGFSNPVRPMMRSPVGGGGGDSTTRSTRTTMSRQRARSRESKPILPLTQSSRGQVEESLDYIKSMVESLNAIQKLDNVSGPHMRFIKDLHSNIRKLRNRIERDTGHDTRSDIPFVLDLENLRYKIDFLSKSVVTYRNRAYLFQYPRRGDIFEGYRFPFHYSAQPLPRELSLTTVPNFERQSHSHTPTRGAFRNNAHKRSATSMSDLGGSFRGVVAAPAVSGNGSFTATAYVNLRMLPHGNDFEDLEVKVDDNTPVTDLMGSVIDQCARAGIIDDEDIDFIFKACGHNEFLDSSRLVYEHSYVRECLKKRIPIMLVMMCRESVSIDDYPTSAEAYEYLLPTTDVRKIESSVLRPGDYQEGDVYASHWDDLSFIPFRQHDRPFEITVSSLEFVNERVLPDLRMAPDNKLLVRTVLFYGDQLIYGFSRDTEGKAATATRIRWDAYLRSSDSFRLSQFPRATKVAFLLFSSRDSSVEEHLLAFSIMNLIDENGALETGKKRIPMWVATQYHRDRLSGYEFLFRECTLPNKVETVRKSGDREHRYVTPVHLTVHFPEYCLPIVCPLEEIVPERDCSPPSHHHTLEELTKLATIVHLDPLTKPDSDQRLFLRKYRHSFTDQPSCLTKYLRCVDWMNAESRLEAHRMLQEWDPPKHPVEMLELLDVWNHEFVVRRYAVRLLEQISDEDLQLYLLQITQLLKFEPYHDSPLARFLMKRALANPLFIGHYFFWHLKTELRTPSCAERFTMMIEEYLYHGGHHVRDLRKQVLTISRLSALADRVYENKSDPGKYKSLFKSEIAKYNQNYFSLFHGKKFQLSVLPRRESSLLRPEKCSVLSSARKPLRLTFTSADPFGTDNVVMFKSGDDLRQDVLTLQMLKVMDKIWLENGLDLRVLVYECISTGHNRAGEPIGMIEMVQQCETISEIQNRYGGVGGGALKKDVLAKYLMETNPSKEAFERARDNFVHSCAGCIVVNGVLGLGDRHCGNMMLTEDGRMFHIDFGHVLGNFKKKLGMNRERSEFVFTPEMAYMIKGHNTNKQQKQEEFERFKRIACKAYLLIRRHGGMFMNLFAMMVTAGMPELQSVQDVDYVRKQLNLRLTESEAEESFSKLIDKSLSDTYRRVDNAIHNLKHR